MLFLNYMGIAVYCSWITTCILTHVPAPEIFIWSLLGFILFGVSMVSARIIIERMDYNDNSYYRSAKYLREDSLYWVYIILSHIWIGSMVRSIIYNTVLK